MIGNSKEERKEKEKVTAVIAEEDTKIKQKEGG